MNSDDDCSQDKTLLIAISQLGKAVDTMQDLLTELETLLHSRRNPAGEDEGIRLSHDIPEDRTVH